MGGAGRSTAAPWTGRAVEGTESRGERRYERTAGGLLVLCVVFVAWTQMRWGGDLATVVFDDLIMTGRPAWAGVVCWRRSALAGARRRFWRLLGASQMSFSLGMMWWDYQQLAQHIDVGAKHVLLRLIPTGGVNLDNITGLFEAGVFAVGITSDLVSRQLAEAHDYDRIKSLAAQYVELASLARKS